MVARAEDCFLGKEPSGLGPGVGSSGLGSSAASASLLLKLSPSWRWSHGGGDAGLSGSSFLDASRSGALATWTSQPRAVGMAATKAVHNAGLVLPSARGIASGAAAEAQPQSDGVLTSVVSGYLLARSQRDAVATGNSSGSVSVSVPVTATLAPGRAGVVSPTTASAPGSSLARNPSFESTNTGSCSTPSFCEGSPATVFPSRVSDVANKLWCAPKQGAFTEARASVHSQLSDHYLSSSNNESLSYGSVDVEDRDAIVNCVDDFWAGGGEPGLLPEFRFEPMLDDTADTGACGLSFAAGEFDALVAAGRGRVAAPLSSMIAATMPAPDFCQSFFAGVEDGCEMKPAGGSKPAQLAIPARASPPAFAYDPAVARLRWSDEPFLPATGASASRNPPADKSPTGSSPSSPTTPLDPHLFASSKLTELQGAAAQPAPAAKRSFAAMQSTSTGAGEKPNSPLRLHGGAAANADKFDAAALSALLYSNSQSGHPDFRSAYSFKDIATAAPPAPKQRRRHGTATDPQSIAARTRREKFTDRIRVLQSLVPNGERLDTVHMLSQTFEYVRFLQHKVWDLCYGQGSLAEAMCDKWKEFIDTSGQVIV